jgi:riboflavin biosynthesis pyrimidine reductase
MWITARTTASLKRDNVRLALPAACEGGPTPFRALLERGLIDQLNLTITPYMFGGARAPTLTGLSKEFLPGNVHCALIDTRVVDQECFLTYRIKRQRRRPS